MTKHRGGPTKSTPGFRKAQDELGREEWEALGRPAGFVYNLAPTEEQCRRALEDSNGVTSSDGRQGCADDGPRRSPGMQFILASNIKEASEYARLADLKPHTWRYVVSARTYAGMRSSAELVELPGWSRRPDRHAINAETKWWRVPHVVISEDDVQALRDAAAPKPPESQWRGVGEQLALDIEPHDDEEFCLSCFAGLESSEHHEKCVEPPKPAKKRVAKKAIVPAAPMTADEFFSMGS